MICKKCPMLFSIEYMFYLHHLIYSIQFIEYTHRMCWIRIPSFEFVFRKICCCLYEYGALCKLVLRGLLFTIYLHSAFGPRIGESYFWLFKFREFIFQKYSSHDININIFRTNSSNYPNILIEPHFSDNSGIC